MDVNESGIISCLVPASEPYYSGLSCNLGSTGDTLYLGLEGPPVRRALGVQRVSSTSAHGFSLLDRFPWLEAFRASLGARLSFLG